MWGVLLLNPTSESGTLVDDSIVRGTTTPHVIKMLRKAGAKEVHMRICAPPIRYPCFFGVDMATQGELIAAQKTIPEIRDFIGADSLGYLSIDGLIKAVALPRDIFCLACFTGDYPIPVQIEMDKLALESTVSDQQLPFNIRQR
jgi:amidophosphoribosyltransferase